MDCTLSLVADAANNADNGKLNVLGVFDRVSTDKYPYLLPQMFVVITFKASAAEFGRKKKFEIVLVDPDARNLTKISASGNVPKPDAGTKATMQIILQMVNTPFPKPGPYQISVLVDGDEKASIPLEAIQVKPPRKRAKKSG